MLSIIRFLRGYLIVVLSGDNPEKILDLCAKNKLSIWGMYFKNNSITAKIDIHSFKKLHSLKKSVKVRVKIVKKCGFPFFASKYNKRVGLLIGAVIFIAIVELLSSFIWNISVTGNETISEKEIITECKRLGISEGVKAKNIDTKNDAQRLILSDGRLAWSSLNIEGCNLTVNISEETDEKGEKNMPSNIKAKCDGIITKIHATSGNVEVKIGDIAAKDDVLISGVIEKLNSTVFARSIGEVTAQTNRVTESEMTFSQIKKIPVGRLKRKSFLRLFGINFPLFIGRINNDIDLLDVKEKSLKITGKKLPVSLYGITYKNTENITVKYSEEKLTEILKRENEKKLKNLNVLSYELISSDTQKTESGIKLTQVYRCEEIISYEDKIPFSDKN